MTQNEIPASHRYQVEKIVGGYRVIDTETGKTDSTHYSRKAAIEMALA